VRRGVFKIQEESLASISEPRAHPQSPSSSLVVSPLPTLKQQTDVLSIPTDIAAFMKNASCNTTIKIDPQVQNTLANSSSPQATGHLTPHKLQRTGPTAQSSLPKILNPYNGSYGKLVSEVPIIEITKVNNIVECQVTTKFKCNVPKCVIQHKTREEAVSHDQLLFQTLQEKHKPFSCEYCGYRSKREKTLKNHERNNHKMQWIENQTMHFRCQICLKVSKNSKSHESHLKRHLMDKRYGCSFCSEAFRSIKAMNQHIQSVHNTDPSLLLYYCSHCNFMSDCKSVLDHHIKKSHFGYDSNLYQCDTCDSKLTTMAYLSKHRREVHGDISLPGYFFCDICKYFGKSMTKLKSHIKSCHLNMKKYLCSKCGAGCDTKIEMNLHDFLHSKIVEKVKDDEKQFLFCAICPFSSVNATDVMEHRGVFSNEIVNCIRCPLAKLIANFEELLVHAEIHVKRKDYRCIKCVKLFHNDTRFLKHIKNHFEDQSEIECTICRKTFMKLRNLKLHMRKNHGNRKQEHLCSICGIT
jgi:hypothetical protein